MTDRTIKLTWHDKRVFNILVDDINQPFIRLLVVSCGCSCYNVTKSVLANELLCNSLDPSRGLVIHGEYELAILAHELCVTFFL
jgi:hypothetical protein